MGLTCLIKLVKFFLYLIFAVFIPLHLWFLFAFTALILDFQNGGRPPSWIFIFSHYLWKTQIYAYVDLQNLVKIGWCAAELLRIFYFQNGDRPPLPRLVFAGPNILLKLHLGRVYTLQYIAIFIFGPFGFYCLFTPLLGEILGILPPNEFRYCCTQKTVLGWKHFVWVINRENPSTCSTCARAREKYSTTNQSTRKK